MQKHLISMTLLGVVALAAGCQQQTTPTPSGVTFTPSYATPATPVRQEPQRFEKVEEVLDVRQDTMGVEDRNMVAPVHFRFDSSAVDKQYRADLQKAAELLKQTPTMQVRIEGYCDWRGTSAYNMSLGQRRATSVKKYLVDLGVEDSRIETTSFGSEKATPNGTAEQTKQDRRADIIVIK